MEKKVLVYDVTLREGAQTWGISFSVNDKVRIAQHLDDLGVDYIEGGWPSANPRDIAFFEAMRAAPLRHAKLAAFGSTCRSGQPASQDKQLRQLLEFGVPVVTVFGKSWDLLVTEGLRISPEENLRIIEDSIVLLRSAGVEAIFDAEHFFDGFRDNPAYALEALRAAARGGAHWVALCDTNGGSLPEFVRAATKAAREAVDAPVGIHTHNDSDLAVANSLVAVDEGARMVQGTINGYGERCGNANLCSVIPALELKMGYRALPEGNLRKLHSVAHFVAEVANMHLVERQPYVGAAAFSHKGGVHIDSVLKLKRSYEHILPEAVGNSTHLLVSDQAGSSTVVERARRIGIDLSKKSPDTARILDILKAAESDGYEFEAAEASFELLLRRHLGQFTPAFEVTDFRAIIGKHILGPGMSEVVVRVRIGDVEELTVADGDGPVHALDNALRRALEPHFPQLAKIHLTDFKVRIVDTGAGTAARVRVLIENTDEEGNTWDTVGVHENIIVASLEALLDGLHYGLLLPSRQPVA